MILTLQRVNHPTYTYGALFINDMYFCDTLEDPIRPSKVPKETAIPQGSYKVILSFSPRFQRFLPLLLNVPNFSGIRIHAGNTTADTEGCILVGNKDEDKLKNSRSTLNKLLQILKDVNSKEPIIINIHDY